MVLVPSARALVTVQIDEHTARMSQEIRLARHAAS
jgi:hypothetical protein